MLNSILYSWHLSEKTNKMFVSLANIHSCFDQLLSVRHIRTTTWKQEQIRVKRIRLHCSFTLCHKSVWGTDEKTRDPSHWRKIWDLLRDRGHSRTSIAFLSVPSCDLETILPFSADCLLCPTALSAQLNYLALWRQEENRVLCVCLLPPSLHKSFYNGRLLDS